MLSADMAATKLSFKVPKAHVNLFKSALEKHQKLDRSSKIHCLTEVQDEGYFLVPTTITAACSRECELACNCRNSLLQEALSAIGLEEYRNDIGYELSPLRHASELSHKGHANNLSGAVLGWLQHLPPDLLQSLDLSIDTLMAGLTKTYTIYEPMLLLPAHTFQATSWKKLYAALPQPDTQRLYSSIAQTTKVTHIALNAPIAAHIPPPPQNDNVLNPPNPTDNILRSPHITPLHGSFGPPPSTTPPVPTPADFTQAFWVSTRQNGITQTWAPTHTMFSRGNVKEKARLLALPSVAQAVREGEAEGTGCAAVDLYAGIGYFAFSYLKAGVDVVLGWEINGWSVEGLRRGAAGNGWGVEIYGEGEGGDGDVVGCFGRDRFLVFQESNEYARGRIEGLRGALPPVRHVNCGLLPTSRGSWETAIAVLDPWRGGWIHLHENIAVKEIEGKSGEITRDIQGIYDRLAGDNADRREVGSEHVERVKTYAPGVMHCVLDIYIPPLLDL